MTGFSLRINGDPCEPSDRSGHAWVCRLERASVATGFTPRVRKPLRTQVRTLPSRIVRHWLCTAAVVLVAACAAAEETYEEVSVDPAGVLRIVTSEGRTIAPEPEQDQVGYSQVLIAPDRRAIGWLALFPNCCTSYPIPLKLVLYAGEGRSQVFTGNGLPVWRWAFSEDARRVAFRQQTVHGGSGLHYELREVSSGRLIAEYDPDTTSSTLPPAWIRPVVN